MISVVVAARNEERHIASCLDALFAQRYEASYEVIVVDNGSDDATRSVVDRFPCRLVSEPRAGQLHAKHRGVREAAGDIVAVLDADCVAPANWLSVIDASFTAEGSDQLAGITCAYRFSKGLPWWGRLYVAAVDHVLIRSYTTFLKSMPFVVGGNVAFRKEYYERFGGYNLQAGIAETELGLARNLRRFGTVKYVAAMVVSSSPRRFVEGPGYFVKYKGLDYLFGYVRDLVVARRESSQT